MKKSVIALSMGLAMAQPLAVPAAEPVGEAVAVMEEVVVTATKTAEKRKDIPNAVVLKDAMDIAESPARGLGELLAAEPGLDWRSKGNFGGAAQEIHIRGMSGNATQVLVNGVIINSPSVGSADVSKIPLNNIDKIEVVKGAGSLLYGSGAMGGTVNIITKRPRHGEVAAKAEVGYGSQQTHRLAIEQGMFINDALGYYLTGSSSETDGFRDNSGLTHNDVSLQVVYDKGELLDLSLYGDYIDREFGVPGIRPPAGTPAHAINGVTFYNGTAADLLNRGSDEDAHFVLAATSSPLAWLTVNAKGHYSDLQNFFLGRYVTDGTGYKSWTNNEVLGAEGLVQVGPAAGATILLGGDYKDFEWENKTVSLDTAGLDLPATTALNSAHLYSRGTFGEAQYRPGRFVKLIGGLRHEVHSTFGAEDLPLYGLVVNPLENTAVKVSHGKHFLAPTPNDLFWPADLWSKGNPDLKPETGWHSAFALEQLLPAAKLFMTLTYFKWDVDNKIQWTLDSNFMFTPQNLDTYKADGWEAGLQVGPFYNVELEFYYTNTDAEEENQFVTRRALYTPEHQFKGSLSYFCDSGLTVNLTSRYTSDRLYYGADKTTVVPVQTLDDYWVTDIRIEQRLADNWLLTLIGNNIFDQGYDTFVGSFFDENFNQIMGTYPGAGSSIFFMVGFEY